MDLLPVEAAPQRVLVLLYDSFAEFEVAVLMTALRGTPHRVTTASPTGVLDARVFTAALGPDDAAWPGIDGLSGLRRELLVVDDHVVTVTGSSYVAFAEAVLTHLAGGSPTDLTFFREPSLA